MAGTSFKVQANELSLSSIVKSPINGELKSAISLSLTFPEYEGRTIKNFHKY